MPEKTIIESNSPISLKKYLKSCYKYRMLIRIFTVRDIKIKYTQTQLGFILGFLQAFSAALVFHFVFGVFFKINTGEIPYIVFAFPGIMAWYYFSYIVAFAGTSLHQSQDIINKIYFPRLLLPIYKSFVGAFELLIWLVVYVCILIYFNHKVSLNIFFIPMALMANIITGLSVAVWLSAFTIRKRDALLLIPFLVGFGIFITPVFYGNTLIPEQYNLLVFINPMAGVIALYRWCLLGVEMSAYYLLGIIPVVFLGTAGLFYFRKVEKVITDII